MECFVTGVSSHTGASKEKRKKKKENKEVKASIVSELNHLTTEQVCFRAFLVFVGGKKKDRIDVSVLQRMEPSIVDEGGDALGTGAEEE